MPGFWDTSALLAVSLDENHQTRARSILERTREMVVWWWAPVEYVSAVSRREREGALTAAAVDALLEQLERLAAGWFEVTPSSRVRRTAQRLLRVHPLRAADSLQLAAAIEVSDGDPGRVTFVALDDRLNRAASREGFPLAEWR